MKEGPSVERRVVSVLFADLVGFTALSESLDAEEVAAVQERYFAAVREVIGRFGGRLEKFIGDAAMAVFGLPRTQDDDAERATRSGLALVNAVAGLAGNVGLGEEALRVRVGVNSGEVAHSPGENGEWRVSGDAVNVAARLQAAAEPGWVLVGEGTALAVAETIALDPPIELELKGKAARVTAWRAVTPLPQRSRERAMGSMRAPLLGRQAELAQLAGAVRRAAAGGVGAMLLIAPPGVGKTRLVDEFSELAGSGLLGPPMLVRRARLGPDSVAPAAAVDQLRGAAKQRPGLAEPVDDDRQSGTLGDEAPVGARPVEASSLEQERRLRFRRWITQLDEQAGDRPQVWLIEDLHWAGGDLLALLEQAIREPATAGRLIVGTARPALLERLATRTEAAPLAVLELPQLNASSTRELVEALVGDALPDSLVGAIIERSDGNPLFVEELLRSWISVGALRPAEEGGWRLDRPIAEVSLPQTVQAIYAAQLDDLPSDARTLVRRGSVAGRQMPRQSLPVMGVEPAGEAVAVVLRRALLREEASDGLLGPALSYRHVLLRDAGYASLARTERARLHALLAAWYERIAGERVEELAEVIARHYAAALVHASRLDPQVNADLDRPAVRRLASEWFERGARWALANAAHETARELLGEAIRHVADNDRARRAGLLLELGEATAYTADMDQGAALIDEALQLFRAAFREASEPSQRETARAGYATSASTLGRVWVQQIRFDDALELAEQVLVDIGHPDDVHVARLLGVRAWVRSTLQQDQAALVDLDRGLLIARRAGERQLELELLNWRAMAKAELGLSEKDDWAEIGQLARQLGNWSLVVRSLRSTAGWFVDDQPQRVWPLAEQAEEVCRRRGLEEDLAWVEYLRSETGFTTGEWQRALEAGRHALEIGERNAYHRAVVRTWHVLLPIAEERGERDVIEHAQRWFEQRRSSLPDSPYARMMQWVFELRFSRAGLCPPRLPPVDQLLPSFAPVSGGPSWLSAMEDVVDSWLASGELDGARRAVERARQSLAGERDASELARGSIELLLSRLIVAESGELAAAEELTREALERFRACQSGWWTAKALRQLREIGSASADELAELALILGRLGVASQT